MPPDPAVRALVERHGRAWSAMSGVTVELVADNAPADVRVFQPADAGRVVAGLAPIEVDALKALDAYQYNRFLAHEFEHDMVWGDRVIALPLLGESLFGVFRADLAEHPRHFAKLADRFRARFHAPMRSSGPVTWQQVAELTAYFAGEANWVDGENAKTPRPSLPPLPAAPAELDRDFHAVAASFVRRAVREEAAAKVPANQKPALFFSYQFEIDTGAPAIASEGFVAALRLLQQLQDHRPADAVNRPLESFRAGKAVFALATLTDLAWLQEPGSPVRDRFGICRVPGSDAAIDPAFGKMRPVADRDGNFVPYHGHGGWVAGIVAGTKDAAAARDLLAYLGSPPVSLEIACEPAWGGGPTRSSHLDNRSGWHNYGLNSARTAQLIDALDGYDRARLLNPVYALRIADQGEYVRVFADHIRPALAGQKSAEAALHETATAWAGLSKNRDGFLRDYRASLGLK